MIGDDPEKFLLDMEYTQCTIQDFPIPKKSDMCITLVFKVPSEDLRFLELHLELKSRNIPYQ